MLGRLAGALGLLSLLASCSHDWDKLQPSSGDAATGGAGTAGTGAAGTGGGGSGGTAGAAGSGGQAGSGGAATCADPSMILVPGTFNSSYCVDRTEVTVTAYEGFLVNAPSVDSQAPECAWNTDFTPSGSWPPTPGTGDRPVTFVDFCDAAAFCKTTGKRLCGSMGGGPLPFGSFADATASEWFNACSESDKRTYPYGNTYDGNACNGTDYGVGSPVKTGSAAKCEGGFQGLLDMSGNVFEWENSCADTTGATDQCRIRGGGFNSNATNLQCDIAADATRNTAGITIGFRCCTDSVPAN